MQLSKLLLATLLVVQAKPSFALYEAHEWGTFTSLVGSDGKTQNGMYHEDEALPSFVHGFGELGILAIAPPDQPAPPPPPPERRPPCRSKGCFDEGFLESNIVTQKMETPVIYFYSDQARTVRVNVRFPEGIITETYPGPIETLPTKEGIQSIGHGDTTFLVDVLPTTTGNIPFVEPNNIYGHARAVNSNIVKSGAETEKFIFYRGMGRFQPDLSITSKNGALRLGTQRHIPQAAFLVHVDDQGFGRMLNVSDEVFSGEEISAKTIRQLKNMDKSTNPLVVSGETANGMLVDALIQSGLYRDEAFAMINTWKNGYLKVPGLRLLYILPSAEVDQILPLTISPAPDQVVRSFIGRIEIMLDIEERNTLHMIMDSGTAFRVESLGRFAEPKLRRVLEVYSAQSPINAETIEVLNTLIKKAAAADSHEATVG